MCDEAKLEQWAKEGLSRRQFGMLGGAAAVTACAPMGEEGDITLPAMSERTVSFATPDGSMDGVFIAPVSGPSPSVLFWPDIASIRESKRNMARRLAGRGYAVLIVNPYYRDVVGQQFEDFADFAGSQGFQKVRPWREKLTAEAIMRDAKAAVGWMDTQAEVDTGRGIGTEGYCMGGPFTFWSAAAVPSRIRAAASFHGGGLVRDDIAMSPHKTMSQSQARYLVAIARDDHARAPSHKDTLREAADQAGRPAQIEVYAGDHGWTVPDSPVYAEEAAEKAYADKLALYEAAL